MSAAPLAGVLVGALLGSAVLLGRPDPPLRGEATRRVARSRPRRAPREGPDAQLLAGARLAERAATLLRAGVLPATAWHFAAAGPMAAAGSVGTVGAAGSTVSGPPVDAPVSVIAVWRLVERTGAPAAAALDACATGLRAEVEARAAVRVAVAGARVSARTVSLLPLAGLGLGALLGAPPWQALLSSAPGRWCAVLGTVLLLLGRWWSARLVRAAVAAGRG